MGYFEIGLIYFGFGVISGVIREWKEKIWFWTTLILFAICIIGMFMISVIYPNVVAEHKTDWIRIAVIFVGSFVGFWVGRGLYSFSVRK